MPIYAVTEQMPNAQRYTVILEAPPWSDQPDGLRHLRAMLKRLGRGYGLACVDVRPAESSPTNQDVHYACQSVEGTND